MNAVARLAVFSLILAAAFVAAATIGSAVGPLERETEEAEHAEEPKGETAHAQAQGFAVELVQGPSLRFRILGPGGRPVEDFDVLHARRMHLILVRRDLAGFQHLHPRQESGATWFVPLALPSAGTWTGFADFSVRGKRTTLSFDLNAPGEFTPRRLLPVSKVATTDGYRVTLRRTGSRLAFDVRRDGRPVRIDRYLGARGHLVALRVTDLAYLHAHAERDELAFETEFPSRGRYRLYLQFKAGGAVHTAEFTVTR